MTPGGYTNAFAGDAILSVSSGLKPRRLGRLRSRMAEFF